jgi:hypothetical protein
VTPPHHRSTTAPEPRHHRVPLLVRSYPGSFPPQSHVAVPSSLDLIVQDLPELQFTLAGRRNRCAAPSTPMSHEPSLCLCLGHFVSSKRCPTSSLWCGESYGELVLMDHCIVARYRPCQIVTTGRERAEHRSRSSRCAAGRHHRARPHLSRPLALAAGSRVATSRAKSATVGSGPGRPCANVSWATWADSAQWPGNSIKPFSFS